MSRNLKALGIAFAAMFAMCAALATAAQATNNPITVTADKYPVTLTGDQIKHGGSENEQNVFSIGPTEVTCKHATFDATIKEAGETSITVTPTYAECHGSAGTIATVTMNGCDYVFHGGEVTAGESNHFTKGTVDLKCPEGVEGVDIHIYTSAHNHSTNVNLCTYKVTPENNLGGGSTGTDEITFTNTPTTSGPPHIPNDFDIVANEVGVTTHRTFGGFLCPNPASTEGTLTGSITVTGFEDPKVGEQGARVGVTISEP